MTGGEIFVRSLLDEGVDTIFGFPGGVVLGLYDVLYNCPELRHILITHEQGGAHAADGYARATGKPGVALVTSGPGGTNTVTGIATAYMDSVPLVVFTGQVTSSMIGDDAFQEADIIGITRPITKHSYLVKDVNNLSRVISEAFHIAATGKPGPVLIDMPKDMLNSRCVYKRHRKIDLKGYNPTTHGHANQITKAAALINSAERPLIYAGGGVISGNASEELAELAKKANIPVTTTLMGLGAFKEDDPLSLGMLGMHGTWYANMAVSECDVLIAIGARFDDRVTAKVDEFSAGSRKIHIDIDPACIEKNIAVDIPIVGSAKKILRELNRNIRRIDTENWLNTISTWKNEHPLKYSHDPDQIKPQFVIEKISEVTKGDAVIITDVGQHQMWTAQYYKFNTPRSLITSGGLGTMGFGLPAALGAAIGRPDKRAVCICGDGGFKMTSFELATAVKYKIPLIIAIINNGYLGMVRQWQELFFEGRYSHTCLKENSPDFVKLAESYGAAGMRAVRPEEVKPVIEEAMKIKDGPVVVEFIVAGDENVFPMVPAGASLLEMRES
ncbi:MAG: biosynthetic-type acetolactate synthase large subunit [bacterium]|nr:biosynthetic-type acetolactate synthase large subunit [bacterium]